MVAQSCSWGPVHQFLVSVNTFARHIKKTWKGCIKLPRLTRRMKRMRDGPRLPEVSTSLWILLTTAVHAKKFLALRLD